MGLLLPSHACARARKGSSWPADMPSLASVRRGQLRTCLQKRGPCGLPWFLGLKSHSWLLKDVSYMSLFQPRVDRVAGSSKGGPRKSGHSGRASTMASRAVSSTRTSSPGRLKCSR